jgi:TctA family transporter
MTRKGQPELALGICVWFSALGGIAGTLSLMALAPPLAEMALTFSTYEYFWLAFLGLMCATMVARSSPVKAIASMLIGLLVSCIGIENPAGTPRFTFGSTDLLGGIEPIPALVGVFAVSEVMRAMLTSEPPKLPYRRFGSILAGQLALTKKYIAPQVRGNMSASSSACCPAPAPTWRPGSAIPCRNAFQRAREIRHGPPGRID